MNDDDDDDDDVVLHRPKLYKALRIRNDQHFDLALKRIDSQCNCHIRGVMCSLTGPSHSSLAAELCISCSF